MSDITRSVLEAVGVLVQAGHDRIRLDIVKSLRMKGEKHGVEEHR